MICIERCRHRVDLHHWHREARSHHGNNCKNNAGLFPAQALTHVVLGAASEDTIGVFFLVHLSEHRFCKRSCHTNQGYYPHPEDRARTSHYKSEGNARDVTNANARANTYRESLERCHALQNLSSRARDRMKNVSCVLYLWETKINGDCYTHSYEQEYEHPRVEHIYRPKKRIFQRNANRGSFHHRTPGRETFGICTDITKQ